MYLHKKIVFGTSFILTIWAMTQLQFPTQNGKEYKTQLWFNNQQQLCTKLNLFIKKYFITNVSCKSLICMYNVYNRSPNVGTGNKF